MREVHTSKFGALTTEQATKSLNNFAAEIERSELLIMFLVLGEEHINNNKEAAKQELLEIYGDDNNNKPSQKLIAFLKTTEADKLFDLDFYERYYCQMAFSRIIDNMLTYFKDILAEIVQKQPKILKSKDLERLDFIFQHENMDELLKAIAEKKIEELFYKGINDIEKYFEDRLGIKLFKDSVIKNDINRLIKTRNIIVHNRSKLTKEFVAEFPDSAPQLGKYIVYNFEDITDCSIYLNNYITELDIELAEKFNLELVKYGVL